MCDQIWGYPPSIRGGAALILRPLSRTIDLLRNGVVLQ